MYINLPKILIYIHYSLNAVKKGSKGALVLFTRKIFLRLIFYVE